MKLFKPVGVFVWLSCFAVSVPMQVQAEVPAATVTASTDVEATMKAMSFAYKKALAAPALPEMQQHISKMQQLVSSVQLVTFSADKQAKFQQGLTEVQLQLNLVQDSLKANDLAQAKQQLKQVDVLKKQYHKERSPSVWQLLFGN